MLVARRTGEVVGLAGLAPLGEGRAELCKLHVRPDCQRRGVGRRLVETLIERARRRGFGQMELHVTATQKAAVHLYQRLNFCEVKRVAHRAIVFGDEVVFDTIYMALSLPPVAPPPAAESVGEIC